MTTPKVSCLMATYGRWHDVRRAVSCFMKQDYPNKELLILNNHPVPLVCNHLGVRVINEPGHPTLGHCRNRLIDMADGEFVRTWDDDDLYAPWCISQGVAHIGGHAAWKPLNSWFSRPDCCAFSSNAMEASVTWRRSDVARHRYRESGGDEHANLLSAIPMLHGDVGWWTGYAYRWGWGHWHISGSLGGDTVENRTRIWLDKNTHHGDGQEIVKLDDDMLFQEFASVLDGVRAAGGYNAVAEWIARFKDEPRDTRFGSKFTGMQQLADRACCSRGINGGDCITVVEFGRLRGYDKREGDGWSTYQFAVHPGVRRVISIDPDPSTEAICRQVIPADALAKVEFRAFADRLPDDIDLLLIDADDSPMVNLQCYRAVERRMNRKTGIIAVDDYAFRSKHLLIRCLLEPWYVTEHIEDLLVFAPR